MNDKIRLKLLKNKNNDIQEELLLHRNKNKTISNQSLKRNFPIASGYFREDFSLNIYKSTSLYKKRYQIEPMRLREQLKRIKIQKKSMKDENTIKSIKIKIKENTFSSDLLRLLKSNKIDRFAKRYMEKKNDKININNNTNNKIVKIFSPKSIIRREEIKLVDEDKISNDDIFNQNLFFRVEKLKGFDNDNFSYGSSSNLEDNTKSNMINSASQTSNNNKCEEDKIKNEKKKLILRPQSHTIMQNNYLYHSLRSYNNSINRKDDINKPNRAFNTPKNYKFEKKLLFWDEENQKIKLFTPRSNKSQSINNIINKFDLNKKLIFSYYNPNDKHIKIFNDIEKKLKYLKSQSINENYKANAF